MPSGYLLVDCKYSGAVIVSYGTHRVMQMLRHFGQCNVFVAFRAAGGKHVCSRLVCEVGCLSG